MMPTYLQKQMLPYQGYLNPKALVPRECILYHCGCVFFTLLVFLFLYFFNVDPVLAVCVCGLLSTALFVSLVRINNFLFKTDEALLDHLIVDRKMDAMKVFDAFFSEVQHEFEKNRLSYFGSGDVSQLPVVDMAGLFEKIFREDKIQLIELFQNQSGNFFLFLKALTPLQREVLYRYYLTKTGKE